MQRYARVMQYTAGQAAEVTGKNISTITRAVKSGKISAHKDTSGAWRIDASELHRVFPLRKRNLRKHATQEDIPDPEKSDIAQTVGLYEELAALRERVAAQSELLEDKISQISDLKEDRDRWRQQATSLLTDLRYKPDIIKKAHPRFARWWNWK